MGKYQNGSDKKPKCTKECRNVSPLSRDDYAKDRIKKTKEVETDFYERKSTLTN